jgi:hypothetical protein
MATSSRTRFFLDKTYTLQRTCHIFQRSVLGFEKLYRNPLWSSFRNNDCTTVYSSEQSFGLRILCSSQGRWERRYSRLNRGF